MGEKDPYPSLLRIDWAYNNYDMIERKKESMTFKSDDMKVVKPLDSYLGPCYIEPSEENMEHDVLDHLYIVTKGNHAYYINPIANGSISW
jgi:hypothetical protein